MNTGMSAIGTKRTYQVALHMSAFGGKADIGLPAEPGRGNEAGFHKPGCRSRIDNNSRPFL